MTLTDNHKVMPLYDVGDSSRTNGKEAGDAGAGRGLEYILYDW